MKKDKEEEKGKEKCISCCREGGEGNENTVTVNNRFLLCTLYVLDISDLHALSHSSLTEVQGGQKEPLLLAF